MVVQTPQFEDAELDQAEYDYRWRVNRSTIDTVRPPKRIRSWDIVSKDIRSHKGEPFSKNDYPWTEGICDAFDDPNVRIVTLQFAARIGKTLLAQALMIAASFKSPATAMFGSSTEQLVKETIKHKYFPMFEKCRHTRGWVPPKSRQLQTRMDLSTMTMYTAWSGSFSTLADKDPRYKHAGEVDKWDTSSSTEADPFELFLERGIEIPDRKTIIESTPGLEGQSRVNSYLNMGWNCRWHCPCPHKKCGHYQELVLGDGDEPGGIVFEKNADGELDEDIAFETATYQCSKCKKKIEEHERRQMIRLGKWVAEGQYVDKKGRIRGQKIRDGEIASFQLSRLYAPTFGFGDIARQFVRCKKKEKAGNDEPMRNFYNSWLGLTWTPKKLATTWDILGPRLSSTNIQTGFSEFHVGTIPAGCNFVTMGVDWQADHHVYTKIAWNYRRAGYLFEYGIAYNEKDLIDAILRPGRMRLPNGDFVDMYSRLTLNDARDGNRHDEVIEFCKKINRPGYARYVWPSMGTASRQMRGRSFDRNEVDGAEGLKARRASRKKRKNIGFYWISVNTNFWQQWMQNCLVKRSPGQPDSLALPIEARDDQDFLMQLLNEQIEIKRNATGHNDTLWVVVDENMPWDFRDCVRYTRCAAEVHNNGNWDRIVPDSVLNTTPPNGEQTTVTVKKPAVSKSKKSAIRKKNSWIPKRRKFIRKKQ